MTEVKGKNYEIIKKKSDVWRDGGDDTWLGGAAHRTRRLREGAYTKRGSEIR